MNIASLDLGSNSFHLLVGRRAADGRIEKVGAKKETLRLGSSVAALGFIPKEPFERALDAVGTMAALARTYQEGIVLRELRALPDATSENRRSAWTRPV